MCFVYTISFDIYFEKWLHEDVFGRVFLTLDDSKSIEMEILHPTPH